MTLAKRQVKGSYGAPASVPVALDVPEVVSRSASGVLRLGDVLVLPDAVLFSVTAWAVDPAFDETLNEAFEYAFILDPERVPAPPRRAAIEVFWGDRGPWAVTDRTSERVGLWGMSGDVEPRSANTIVWSRPITGDLRVEMRFPALEVPGISLEIDADRLASGSARALERASLGEAPEALVLSTPPLPQGPT